MKKKNMSFKNVIGIVIIIAAAGCFLFSFAIEDQDLRSVADISIFSPAELEEVYYTAENVKILERYGVRIEESSTDSDLDYGPAYSYYPEDDYPETGVFASTEVKLRDTYYLIELQMLDGTHTAVMSVENDGPVFEAGETISLCGWVSRLAVTDKAEYTELKEAAKAAHPDAAPEADFTLYYRGATLEEVAEAKSAERKGDKTLFIVAGVVLMVVGGLLRGKKYEDPDDMPEFE